MKLLRCAYGLRCVSLSVWLAVTVASSDAHLSRVSLRRSQRVAGAPLQSGSSVGAAPVVSQDTALISEEQLEEKPGRGDQTESGKHRLSGTAAYWPKQLRKSPGGGDQTESGKQRSSGRAADWAHWGGVALFSAILAVAFGLIAFKLVQLFIASRPAVRRFKNKGFKEYLVYSFECWFEKTDDAVVYVVVTFTALTLLLGSCVYAIGMGTNLFVSLWKVFAWLVAPDAGVTETSYYGLAVGGVVSVIGLIIFALILMVLQDSFLNFLKKLTEGSAPVVESGHTLLIGFTGETVMLIQELCKAHEDRAGTTIVVLSDTVSKPDMEQSIRDADFDLLGSQIVVRCGQVHDAKRLRQVAAHTAETIILLPDLEDSYELRDAVTLQGLVALQTLGYPHDGRIIVLCSLPRNAKLFEEMGGNVDVVMSNDFMAKVMVKCSKQTGLGRIFTQLLGFADDSEFYLKSTPEHLVGCTFSDADLFYPKAVLVGLLDQTRKACTFCPGGDYELKSGDELVLLAADSSAATAEDVALAKGSHQHGKGVRLRRKSTICIPDMERREGVGETIVIIGWNDLVATMLLELDMRLPPDSKVMILAPQKPTEREAIIQHTHRRRGCKLGNITSVQQLVGEVGSRFALETLPTPIEEASRIFLLAGANVETPGKADAATFITFLQIRELLASRGANKYITIIPEIRKPSTEQQCADAAIPDFINTGTLPSRILSMVAYNHEIMAVLNEIITDESRVDIKIRRLSAYRSASDGVLPEALSFVTISRIVGCSGDIAIGWSKQEGSQKCAKRARSRFQASLLAKVKAAGVETRINEYELNPQDKTVEREWSMDEDMVVVLTPK